MTKREVLTIWKALSSLESAYSLTRELVKERASVRDVLPWEMISEATDILEKELIGEETKGETQ